MEENLNKNMYVHMYRDNHLTWLFTWNAESELYFNLKIWLKKQPLDGLLGRSSSALPDRKEQMPHEDHAVVQVMGRLGLMDVTPHGGSRQTTGHGRRRDVS